MYSLNSINYKKYFSSFALLKADILKNDINENPFITYNNENQGVKLLQII